MKISILDAHDRFSFLNKQDFSIGKCCQDLINQRPFGEHAFYIFGHSRTIGMDERIALFNVDFQDSLMNPTLKRKYHRLEDVPTHRFIWQPRLTKPAAQSNSMLFKAYPGTDNIKVIWMIPARELWSQYKQGLLTQNETIFESIYDFEHNRGKLEAKEPDDLSDAAINMIYEEISRTANRPKFEMV
jgi:hypothetical protein